MLKLVSASCLYTKTLRVEYVLTLDPFATVLLHFNFKMPFNSLSGTYVDRAQHRTPCVKDYFMFV